MFDPDPQGSEEENDGFNGLIIQPWPSKPREGKWSVYWLGEQDAHPAQGLQGGIIGSMFWWFHGRAQNLGGICR